MSREIANFLIAVAGLAVAVAAIVFANNINKTARFVIGCAGFFAAAYFGIMGLVEPVNVAVPSATVAQPTQTIAVKNTNEGRAVNSSTVPISCNPTPHVPLAQKDHFLPGALHIAELWRSNGNSPWGDKLVRAIVRGDLSIVAAGGAVWTFPKGCDANAEIDVVNNPNVHRVISEDELRAAGFIR